MCASLIAQPVKNLPAVQETQAWSLGWEDLLRRKWQPSPVFLPEESHGQRSLVGYHPWGHTESDMTEQITIVHSTHSPGIYSKGLAQKVDIGRAFAANVA